MIKVQLTPAQAEAARDVFWGRDCDEYSMCGEAGFTDSDMDGMCDELLRGRFVQPEAKAQFVAEELLHYHDLRGDSPLLSGANRILAAIALSKGIPPKPKPKRAPKPKPVMTPSTKHRTWALRAPEGANRYCGPVAIAALTGTTTDRVAALIRGYRVEKGQTRPAVRGIYNLEMLRAFRDLGFEVRCAAAYATNRPTLSQFYKQVLSRSADAPRIIVNVTDHYVAMHGDSALCSLNEGRQPRHVAFAASARKRVINAWEVTPRAAA